MCAGLPREQSTGSVRLRQGRPSAAEFTCSHYIPSALPVCRGEKVNNKRRLLRPHDLMELLKELAKKKKKIIFDFIDIVT